MTFAAHQVQDGEGCKPGRKVQRYGRMQKAAAHAQCIGSRDSLFWSAWSRSASEASRCCERHAGSRCCPPILKGLGPEMPTCVARSTLLQPPLPLPRILLLLWSLIVHLYQLKLTIHPQSHLPILPHLFATPILSIKHIGSVNEWILQAADSHFALMTVPIPRPGNRYIVVDLFDRNKRPGHCHKALNVVYSVAGVLSVLDAK